MALIITVLLQALRGILSVQNIVFSHYESSALESEWVNNVEIWQNDVCSYFSRKMIEKYIKTVAFVNHLSDNKMLDYITGAYKVFSKYISHFHYNVSDGSGKIGTIAIPIEGIIGLARDPRKCYDVNSENFTQSKAFLIPMRGTVEKYYISLLLSSNSRFANDPTDQTNYLFDAGATFYSDTNSQGTKWIVDWYRGVGLTITNVVAWEKKPMMGDLAIEGIPDHLVHGYQYFNHPIKSHPMSVWNPLQFIKKKCKVSDFVVFKLDIDHKSTESEIVHQLKYDDAARARIDEFFYEEHFNNTAMRMHGWMMYWSTLADYYRIAIPLRKKGFRIHYWP